MQPVLIKRFREAAALLLVTAMLLSLPMFAWAADFTDVTEDAYYYDAVQWAVKNGVSSGNSETTFGPLFPCDRSQVVTFLWNLEGKPTTDEEMTFADVQQGQWYTEAIRWAASEKLVEGYGDNVIGYADRINREQFVTILYRYAQYAGLDVSGGEDANIAAYPDAETISAWALPSVRWACASKILNGYPDGTLRPDGDVTRSEAVTLLYRLCQAEPETGGGTPWTDYDLREELAGVTEKPASGKDDFYLYANYDWLKGTEIRPGYAGENTFNEVSDEITEMGVAVLTDKTLTGHDAELSQQLYAAFLDWDARNAQGVEPIMPYIEAIENVSSLDELNELFADPNSDIGAPFGLGNTVSFNDSSSYIVAIVPMGLLLGDSAEYSEPTEMGRLYTTVYTQTGVTMLQRLGYTEEEAAAIMSDAFAVEGALAEGIMTSAEQMSSDYISRINNEMSRDEVAALTQNFPLMDIIDALGYGSTEKYLVMEPDYLTALDGYYREEHLQELKNYYIADAALGNMSLLDREGYELAQEASNALSGSEGAVPDEETAFNLVRSLLTTPMDKAFLEKYDATQMKQDITRICQDSIDYYRTMLSEEDWLSAETREKAVEKLDAITINAVYPEKWRDYSALSLDGLSYFECLKAIADFEQAYDRTLIGQKADTSLWDFDILETNAYYNPQDNSINIIRGILGGAFYRDGMSDEELYAGIGTVIGHEISHAFDTNGAQFDAEGNLVNWWTQEDYAAFTERAGKLAAYYNGMTAFDGYQVQGQNIQTEAIADMAGLKCMLGILSEKDDIDYEAFFMGYAKIWRRIITRELEYFALMQDSHPLHYLRVNATLQQFPQFLETFDIQPGDGMYLAPEDSVLVW